MSNYVQLIGNLGRDVEVQTFDNGTTRARVSMATKEVFQDRSGEKKVTTQWHDLVAWGKVAEMMQVFLKKGSSVVVQGKLHHYATGEAEQAVRRTEVVVKEFRLMS
jgi:single-strand DNA-binding protein